MAATAGVATLRKVRIAHITDCYPPRSGGIESQVADLAAQQAAAGDDVHVLTATPAARPRHAGPSGSRPGSQGGATVHRIVARLPFELPVNPAAPHAVRALLRELSPDVVHVHAGVVSPFAFDGARIAIRQGLPTVITWHCMLDGVVLPLRAAVRASGWREAPVALSAVSRVAASRVAQVFEASVQVLPNGIDLEAWSPGRGLAAAAHGDGVRLRLVAATRLAPRKRAAALIDVLAAAAAELPPGSVCLTIFGSGPAARQVAVKAAALRGEPSVELRGRVPRAELRAAYTHADAFLAPAALESFGLAALEARTAGLAVLARRGTGIEEFVDEEVDGLLVASDADMARAVVRLARDPSLLAAIRCHNRAAPPGFGWPRALALAAAEYRRAIRLATVDHRVGL